MPDNNNDAADHTPDPLAVGELISLAQAADSSGFSRKYLRDIAESGRLKSRKIGRNWVTTMAALEEYKRTRKVIIKKD